MEDEGGTLLNSPKMALPRLRASGGVLSQLEVLCPKGLRSWKARNSSFGEDFDSNVHGDVFGFELLAGVRCGSDVAEAAVAFVALGEQLTTVVSPVSEL